MYLNTLHYLLVFIQFIYLIGIQYLENTKKNNPTFFLTQLAYLL